MNRVEFIKRIIRFLLFGVLAAIVAITGSKAVAGGNCSTCPGKGICSGETDCLTFLSEKK
jgi:hypothetical protein